MTMMAFGIVCNLRDKGEDMIVRICGRAKWKSFCSRNSRGKRKKTPLTGLRFVRCQSMVEKSGGMQSGVVPVSPLAVSNLEFAKTLIVQEVIFLLNFVH